MPSEKLKTEEVKPAEEAKPKEEVKALADVQKRLHELGEYVEKRSKDVEELARKQPFLAIGLALLTGLCIGVFVGAAAAKDTR